MENIVKKHVQAVKEIRKRENFHYEKAAFCREHNMNLDAMFHQQMEQEMRRLSSKIEDILDTGYVSLNIAENN